MNKKPAKKSETLEIRLTHETKLALMTRARSQHSTASEIIRGLIEHYLALPAANQLSRWENTVTLFRRYLSPGSVALLLGSIAAAFTLSALPSVGQPDLRSAFRSLDGDEDGFLSVAEFESQVAAAPAEDSEAPLWPPHRTAIATVAESAPDTVYFVFSIASEAGGAPSALTIPVVKPYKDGDGKPGAVGHFNDLDLSSDGLITFEEFEWHHDRNLTAAFQVLDANGDKGISATEIAAMNVGLAKPDQVLLALDHDSNGSISLGEFVAGTNNEPKT